jgi:hypothetical protein
MTVKPSQFSGLPVLNALALLGHSNRQMNMTRRDLIKPDLSYDYLHLCAHSLPYTDMLFGGDVSKSIRDIESCRYTLQHLCHLHFPVKPFYLLL